MSETVHLVCERPTPHIFRPRGFAPLDHLEDGLMHHRPLITAQGGFSNVSAVRGEGHAIPRIHSYAALKDHIQSTTKHSFHISFYAPTRSSILPVFKRLAACFDP